MRAIWKGAIAFGLVNVPVKVYSATEDHDISLHQVHNADGGRIRYQRRCTSGGEYADVVGSWTDITGLKQVEAELTASTERYRQLFETNPQPMWVYDSEALRFLAVNDASVALYGYSAPLATDSGSGVSGDS